MKKIGILMLTLALVVTSLIGCTNTDEKNDSKIKIGMITDVGGINDESFNQSTWNGLQKAKEELNIDVTYVESKQEGDYVQNIETLIDQNVDLILGVGFKLTDAIEEASKLYPNQNFAIIDGEFANGVPSNVKNIMFKEEEAGYLAGVLASKMTKTNVVGFIGGMEVPVVDRYKYGFMAGVEDTMKESKVKMSSIQISYANSFTDSSKGKAIANQMIKNDTDIIFHAAGPVGNGMFEALKEKGLVGIGVDMDQNKLAPDTVVTSAVKHLNIASYNLAKELKKGNFKGGVVELNTLANDGVGLADYNKVVTKEAKEAVDKAKEKIIKREIVVPSTKDEYKNYISSK